MGQQASRLPLQSMEAGHWVRIQRKSSGVGQWDNRNAGQPETPGNHGKTDTASPQSNRPPERPMT